jgi:hypothetical protein
VTGVECGGGAQALLHPRPSLFHPGYLNHGDFYGGAEFCVTVRNRLRMADTKSTSPSSPTTNPRKNPPMLKLHAGVSKKVGLPGFSSASASCTIEAELDSTLLNDTEGFQTVVRRAYASCEQAVQDEIARLTHESPDDTTRPQEVIEVRTSPAISGAAVTINRAALRDAPSPRPATASQVRALRAIAARRKIDLLRLLRDRFGLTTADELGIRQASTLIDELKSDEPAASPSNGNGAYATTGGAL